MIGSFYLWAIGTLPSGEVDYQPQYWDATQQRYVEPALGAYPFRGLAPCDNPTPPCWWFFNNVELVGGYLAIFFRNAPTAGPFGPYDFTDQGDHVISLPSGFIQYGWARCKIVSATVPQSAAPGARITIPMNIRNWGYAGGEVKGDADRVIGVNQVLVPVSRTMNPRGRTGEADQYQELRFDMPSTNAIFNLYGYHWDYNVLAWARDDFYSSYTIVAEAMQVPSVDTGSPTGLHQTGATLNGNVTSMGSAATVQCYFEYRRYGGVLQTTPAQGRNGVGAFSWAIMGLDPGTQYSYRAVVVGDGSAYGDWVDFTTPVAPIKGRNLQAAYVKR